MMQGEGYDGGCCGGGPEPYINLCGVSLHYGADAAVVDVTLPVESGAVTALVGPSGAGKSSILSCINRLTDFIPGARVTGAVRVGGEDVFAPVYDPVTLRRKVGYIFQKPNPFPMSIFRNLSLPLQEHGIRNRGEVAARIEMALADVGLWDEVKDRLNSRATTLSGGQQQRLCMARALVLEPSALLLDEPCSALDPIASARVEELILRLKDRYTMLMVTHNLEQARRVADYVALLWAVEGGAGQVLEYGPSAGFFEAPQHPLTAAYVGSL